MAKLEPHDALDAVRKNPAKLKRPAGIPAEATRDPADGNWEMGQWKGALRVGEWTWWRPDGTLWARGACDGRGRQHGTWLRYHPNGEVASIVPFERGKWHGKQVATRPTSGEAEADAAAILEDADAGIFRYEVLNLRGKLQKPRTYYNKRGLRNPIEVDAEGRAVGLERQLNKLLPETSLALLTPAVRTIVGPLRLLPTTEITYLGLALVRGTIHRIGLRAKSGAERLEIVEAAEIGRSFTLAVDWLAAKSR